MLFSNVIITIRQDGIQTKNGFGKKRSYQWEEIEEVINNPDISDGVSGCGKGITFKVHKTSKKDKDIHVFNCKKLTLAIEEFVPKNKIKKE